MIFVHYLLGIFAFLSALFVMRRLNKEDKRDIIYNLLFILGILGLVASVWEIFEYTSDFVLGTNLQHAIETGVQDTMEEDKKR